jgi:hypothetical protein
VLRPSYHTDPENGQTYEDSLSSAIYQNIVRILEDELEHRHSNILIEDLDVLAQTLDFARYGGPINSEKSTSSWLVPMGRGAGLADSKRQ